MPVKVDGVFYPTPEIAEVRLVGWFGTVCNAVSQIFSPPSPTLLMPSPSSFLPSLAHGPPLPRSSNRVRW